MASPKPAPFARSRDRRLGLVMGRSFAPRDPLWGKLADLRRSGNHLFLRYAFT